MIDDRKKPLIKAKREIYSLPKYQLHSPPRPASNLKGNVLAGMVTIVTKDIILGICPILERLIFFQPLIGYHLVTQSQKFPTSPARKGRIFGERQALHTSEHMKEKTAS